MNVHMEIICVGNELLIGKTLNTNAQWIAKRATSLGIMVKRITVVGDDVNEIANVVKEALKGKPRFLITTGGLGPTFDDLTLEGLAKGMDRKLAVDKKALEMIRKKYEEYQKQIQLAQIELTPARIKMATFPEGTEPLPNPVGTAPGMMAKVGETFLIALPGVPPEMEAIFEESVVDLLKTEVEDTKFFETSVYADGMMESALAPLIDMSMRDNPYVYIKSHVYTKGQIQTEGRKSHIELHFSTTAKNPEIAQSRLDKAVRQLSELIRKHGGSVQK